MHKPDKAIDMTRPKRHLAIVTAPGEHKIFASASIAARPELLPRPALLARLDACHQAKLTVIEAPAGYGKTALLAEWCRHLTQLGETVVSLALSPEMAEIEVFLGALMGAACLPPATQPAGGDPRQTVGRAAAALDTLGRVSIILDDYDLASNAGLDATVCTLLDKTDHEVRWVVVSKGQLPLRGQAWWLAGQVAEIGAEDLRFTESEIATLLGPFVSSADLAVAAEWTEGWPIAVQLLRHQLQQSGDPGRGEPGRLTDWLEKPDSDLARYLTRRVLGALPEEQRELLLQMSFLEEFDCELVSAVTGIAESWRMLEALEQANLLMSRVVAESAVYRCHKLLRQLMFMQLKRRGRVLLARLRSAAARHYREIGNTQAAVAEAAGAGDCDLVATLIEEAGGILYGVRYGSPALEALLRHVPSDVMARRPRLAVAQVLVLVKQCRHGAAADLLHSVRLRLAGSGPALDATDRRLARDLALAEITLVIYGRGDIRSATLDVLEAEIAAAPPEGHWLRGVLNNLLCVAHYRQSDWPAARASAEAARYYYGLVRSSNGIAHMHLHLGIISTEAADPTTAERHFASAREAFRTALRCDDAGCAMADIMKAETLYEQGRFGEARQLCATSLKFAENAECHYELLIAGYRTLSALAVAEAGPQQGIRALAAPLAFVRQHGFVHIERHLLLRRTELALLSGETAGLDTLPEIGTAGFGWREFDLKAMNAARLALNRGDTEEASTLLDRQINHLAAAPRPRAQVYALALLAIVLDRGGRRGEALARLKAAVGLAMAGHLVAPFLEHGREMLAMLAQLVTGQGLCAADPGEVQFVNRVIQAATQATACSAGLFSQREEEIVNLLVKGTNNKLIARALGISPDTVRFHLKHIYEKFGVSDRRIVAELARESGLVA